MNTYMMIANELGDLNGSIFICYANTQLKVSVNKNGLADSFAVVTEH